MKRTSRHLRRPQPLLPLAENILGVRHDWELWQEVALLSCSSPPGDAANAGGALQQNARDGLERRPLALGDIRTDSASLTQPQETGTLALSQCRVPGPGNGRSVP